MRSTAAVFWRSERHRRWAPSEVADTLNDLVNDYVPYSRGSSPWRQEVEADVREFVVRKLKTATAYQARGCTVTQLRSVPVIPGGAAGAAQHGPCTPWMDIESPAAGSAGENDIEASNAFEDGAFKRKLRPGEGKVPFRVRVNGVYNHDAMRSTKFGAVAVKTRLKEWCGEGASDELWQRLPYHKTIRDSPYPGYWENRLIADSKGGSGRPLKLEP